MISKTIIVDLDRTLLHTDKTVSTYTADVFKKCKALGYKIIAATARPLRTTIKYDEIIKFDALIVSNGARLIYKNKRIECAIDNVTAVKLLREYEKYPELRITLETGDIAYSNKPIEDYETIVVDKLSEIVEKEVTLKLIISYDNDESLAKVKESLFENLYYTIAHNKLIQIMNKSATKWNGIKSALDIINCKPEEAIYFGDDNDDIEPIKKCGIGVAVSNGIEDAKNAADYITDSNDDDGVAKFIEQYILYNK